MKKIVLIFLACTFAFAQGPQNKKIGIGLYAQKGPTHQSGFGLTGQYWLNSNYSVDGYVSVENDFSAIEIAALYKIHFLDLVKVSQGKLPFYYGFGGALGLWDGGYAIKGLATFGVEYQMANAPISFFTQIDPQLELDVYDNRDNEYRFNFLIKLGARYHF